MSKYVKKSVKVQDLHVDFALNGRDADDLEKSYDLDSMVAQILQVRRIIQPIICEMRPITGKEAEGDKLVVLAGNRRTLAGQKLTSQPDCPADVLANLSKVEILLYSDLTDEERYSFVFDQGSQLPLAKHEIVKGIWRMWEESYFSGSKEAKDKILSIQWHNLAAFTGKGAAVRAKLEKIAPNDRAGRIRTLREHYHGTLDNVLLGVYGMGPIVKEQYLLTLKELENRLLPDEKVRIYVTTKRITELSKAKNLDKKSDEGWTPTDGGKLFNELLKKFEEEDNGNIIKSKATRPTVDQLLQIADNYSCSAVRKAIKMAAGGQVMNLAEESDALYRLEKVSSLLHQAFDSLPKEVQPLINAVLNFSPAKFQEFLRDSYKINVNL